MEDQVSMGTASETSGYIRQGGPGKIILSIVRILTASVVIAAAIVASGYMGLCAYAANGKTIWPGISVMGQDLGGLTIEDAALKLNNFIDEASIQLYLYNQNGQPGDHERAPDYVLGFADLGFEPDTLKIASDAYDMNVTTPEFYTLGWRYLTGEGETEFHPTLELDAEQVELRAQEVAEALSYPVTDADYYLVGEESLTVNLPIDGRAVYAEDVSRQLNRVIASSPNFVFDIPYTVVERNLLTAQEIHDDVYIPVKNAYYNKSAGAIAPGQVSRDFNVEALQTLMDNGTPGEAVHIDLTHQEPAISYSHLESVLFRDVLGSASTHVSGTAARINNVRLASKAFNGTVLNAGDVFSYNGTVGQRTKAKGYQAAPAYVEGQTVDEIGGGVCQPSSNPVSCVPAGEYEDYRTLRTPLCTGIYSRRNGCNSFMGRSGLQVHQQHGLPCENSDVLQPVHQLSDRYADRHQNQ